jgi:hypothetical protein
MLQLNHAAVQTAIWSPATSSRIHMVETAVLLGVMGHFAGLLVALMLF